MARAARSPVRVVVKKLLFGLKRAEWRCPVDADLEAAQFRSRKDERRVAILHRSTKYPGEWQISMFDEQGPYADQRGATCDDALRNAGMTSDASGWKLEEAVRRRR